ncbi:zinc-dependent alcohol dehydrogenase family protein [Blastopirellula marina]|uniref:alcohol dehydrogenase n=1 Tax=Blastopirellula marina TaxID=124 RepID=A0A2S8F9L7_9BACT|nr:zinc-dependent alcohol dehydrogenase family protein [Blastopirellula marina]PQO28856.1 alcohol dehydrogenase [Blastopirellula marina]PTL42129.1 alcohol dehydrogenase [Blastopirellula marina]
MKALVLREMCSLNQCPTPLELVDLPVPHPQAGEILIRVAACGICHTELDEIEGRTSPPQFPVVPGHEVVGYVEQLGAGVTVHQLGDRVGVGWIHSSSGDEHENVSPQFQATGRDVNGGYAEYMTAPANYAYPIPDCFRSAEAAPLLCAGAIGYRAVRLTGIQDGQTLGLTGFGGSAHLVLQMVRHQFPNTRVFVFARHPEVQQFALELGAAWAGHTEDRAPEPLDAIIDTTPAWKPVVEGLANLAPGGRLVINAIRKEESDKEALLKLSYHEHLWMEREIKTVANITQFDIREFLPLAAEIPIRPEVATYSLDQANQALVELKQGRIKGAKVLVMEK